MTAHETAAALSRWYPNPESGQEVIWNGLPLVYFDGSWHTAATLVARLTAAEADADRMFAWGRCTDRCGGVGADFDTRCHCGWEKARSLHAQAVALRERPS